MTEHEKLMKIFNEADTQCVNTFCNTCPYNDIKDGYSCAYHAYADKLFEYGYLQNNFLNKDIIRKAIEEELVVMLTDIINTIDDSARNANAYDSELLLIIINALKTVQRSIEND